MNNSESTRLLNQMTEHLSNLKTKLDYYKRNPTISRENKTNIAVTEDKIASTTERLTKHDELYSKSTTTKTT